MKSQYDTIVVGTGLGGLIAAAEIALAGKTVCCIEAHTKTGGALSHFKRGPYTFEVSLHALDGLDQYDTKLAVFQKLGIDKALKFVRLPELFRYEDKETAFTCACNMSQAASDLKKLFPDEATGIDTYFSTLSGIRSEIFNLANLKMNDIPRLMMFPRCFPNVYRNYKKTLAALFDECFSCDAIKRILSATLMYYHCEPRTMSLVYFALGQGSFHAGGGWYIAGGSFALSQYLTDFICAHGGKVLTGHTVTALHMRGKRVDGVMLRPTAKPDTIPELYTAKTVIANAALPCVIDMLPSFVSQRLRKKYGSYSTSMSVFTVYLGLKKPTSSIGNTSYSLVMNSKNPLLLNDLQERNAGRYEDRPLIFIDYGQIESGIVPPGRSQAGICIVDNVNDWNSMTTEEYKAKKEAVAQLLISRVEERLPGLRELIDTVEVSTAKTLERYMRTPGGSVYGYEQTVSQAIFNRPGVKSRVKGLYFASAWSFPGGGFSGAIICGHSCARVVLKKLKWW